jgi:uncharacterized protein YfaS (alpha-2-macroglobulin family)
MWKSSLSVGLVLASIVALSPSEAGSGAGSSSLVLECKPQYSTAPDIADPITIIRLSLTDGAPQIIHVARSGRTFSRADQYSFAEASWAGGQFTWTGKRKKSPNLTMVGQVKRMTDDDRWFSYVETLFNENSGLKHEMFSVCSPSTKTAKAAMQPATSGTQQHPPEKAGVVSHLEAQSDAQHGFEFRRLIIDRTRSTPEACFRFSRILDGGADAHYGDYIRTEPVASLAVRTVNTDLCVAGLDQGTSYKVTLAAGLPSGAGERTPQAATVDVSLGDKPPLISISGDGYILSRTTSSGLAIQTVNIDRVKIHVLRMSDQLVPGSKNVIGGSASQGSYDPHRRIHTLKNGGLSRYKLQDLLNKETTLVWSGTMDIAPDHNRTVQTAFPIASVIKADHPGAYLVLAEDAAQAIPEREFTASTPSNDEAEWWWQEDDEIIPAHWIIVTDIALTAMSAADGLHVIARSLRTAGPISGARVSLISKGQDQLGEAVTNETGQAFFAPGLLRGRGAGAASLIAAYGPRGDFAVMDLDRPAFDFSDRGVAGRPNGGLLEAFVYTDRGVYRPGETVEAVALLRDRRGDAIANTPLTLVLRRPDGVEARRFSLLAMPAAGFHQAISLSRSAPFGQWSVEALLDPTGDPIGRSQFSVQDFVPQTLKVEITSSTPTLDADGSLELTIDGQFLYGAPAAGLHGEADLKITRNEIPVPGAAEYSFGLIDENVDPKAQRIEIPATDERGHAEIIEELDLPESTSPLKLVVSAGLFEPSGRAVKQDLELPIRTRAVLIGLKPRFRDKRAEEGKAAIIDVRAFGPTGDPIAVPGLQWRLVRENRVYDWFEMNDVWRWHYHTTDEEIAAGNIDVSAEIPTSISQPVSWGRYRLEVEDPDTGSATSIRFVAGWAETADSAETPDKVEVSVEKPLVQPGQQAKLRIKGPFAGKAQITVAGDRIFENRQIEVPQEGVTVPVKASADWGAGAYVIVNLIRPLAAGGPRDPVRAVGLAWLGIDPTPRTLSVAISAPDKVAPRQRTDIAIQVRGAMAGEPTYLTLAAVDEGILQLTRFTTPDPASFFYGQRGLGMDIRDDYGRLLDGSADAGPIHQGGDAADAPMGGQPLAVRSTRTVALFSGPVQVGTDGLARISLDIPDFAGQVRLMAVAYSQHGVGHAERTMLIRDPLVVDLSLPRFLAPGDAAKLALSLHNTDGPAGAYKLDLSTAGAAALAAGQTLDFWLELGERRTTSISLEGKDGGVAIIRADLSGPYGYRQHREWQIAIRSPHYPVALEETARQGPGESFSVDASKLAGFVPGSVTVSVGYSAFAGIDIASLLQSLNRYPHGCTEQLTSTAFPLLYFDDPMLLGRAEKDQGVRQRVQATIDMLLDRQGRSGKFGLWTAGDDGASPWLNVYVLDFLLHASEVGYQLPEAPVQRALDWLTKTLPELDQENSGYRAESAPITRAYAFYVIARAGRVDPAQLRYMYDRLDPAEQQAGGYVTASIGSGESGETQVVVPSISLGHLGAALTLMGDNARARESFRMALQNIGIRNRPSSWSDTSYYSEVQDTAGLLAAAAEVGNDEVTQNALERLKRITPTAEKLNTQEKAQILSAAHALSKRKNDSALVVNGKPLGPRTLPIAFSPTPAELTAGFTVANAGPKDVWRTIVIRGAPIIAPPATSLGYSLEKEYLSPGGEKIDPTRVRQNDRFLVSIKGSSSDYETHQTVLVDPLPAGWEIEATVAQPEQASASDDDISSEDTSAKQQYAFLGELTKPTAVEARDDRFVAAFNIGPTPSRFHLAYVVRVVTPGTFALPEAVVEDMYRPSVMARTDAWKTDIHPY